MTFRPIIAAPQFSFILFSTGFVSSSNTARTKPSDGFGQFLGSVCQPPRFPSHELDGPLGARARPLLLPRQRPPPQSGCAQAKCPRVRCDRARAVQGRGVHLTTCRTSMFPTIASNYASAPAFFFCCIAVHRPHPPSLAAPASAFRALSRCTAVRPTPPLAAPARILAPLASHNRAPPFSLASSARIPVPLSRYRCVHRLPLAASPRILSPLLLHHASHTPSLAAPLCNPPLPACTGQRIPAPLPLHCRAPHTFTGRTTTHPSPSRLAQPCSPFSLGSASTHPSPSHPVPPCTPFFPWVHHHALYPLF